MTQDNTWIDELFAVKPQSVEDTVEDTVEETDKETTNDLSWLDDVEDTVEDKEAEDNQTDAPFQFGSEGEPMDEQQPAISTATKDGAIATASIKPAKQVRPSKVVDNVSKLPEILQAIAQTCETGLVPLLIGEPGIGKTACVEELAKATGKKLINIALNASLPEDLSGLPGKTNVGTGEHVEEVVDFIQYRWQKAAKEGNCIVFFDEFLTAGETMFKVVLKLLSERLFANDSEPLPESTWLIAACNPVSQGVDSVDMPPVVANRFVLLPFSIPFSDWIKWLEGNKETKTSGFLAVANFLRVHPRLAQDINAADKVSAKEVSALDESQAMVASSAWPSRRSWTNFAKIAGGSFVHLLGPGIIGQETYAKFISDSAIDVTPYLNDPQLWLDMLPKDGAKDVDYSKRQTILSKIGVTNIDLPKQREFLLSLIKAGQTESAKGMVHPLLKVHTSSGTAIPAQWTKKLIAAEEESIKLDAVI
jgi:MoxR-like ATPase